MLNFYFSLCREKYVGCSLVLLVIRKGYDLSILAAPLLEHNHFLNLLQICNVIRPPTAFNYVYLLYRCDHINHALNPKQTTDGIILVTF